MTTPKNKGLAYLIAFLCFMLGWHILSSCETKDFNFPKQVSFSREGGERFISGSADIDLVLVSEDKPDSYTLFDMQDSVTRDWLTVYDTEPEYNGKTISTYRIRMKATPNKTGKTRRLFLDWMYCNYDGTIEVIQEK